MRKHAHHVQMPAAQARALAQMTSAARPSCEFSWSARCLV